MSNRRAGPGEGRKIEPGGFGWTHLRAQMEDSNRSDAGKAAGLWAIDVLRGQFGDDWMERVARQTGSPPDFLLSAPMHTNAFAELLDLSLRLYLVDQRKIDGQAKVCRGMKGNLQGESLLHGELALEVAALALQSSYDVVFEKRLDPASPPTDVVVETPAGRIPCEAFTIFVDETMRRDLEYSRRVGDGISSICFDNRVEIDGALTAILTEEETAAWLAVVAQTAALVNADRQERLVDHPQGKVTVFSMAALPQREFSFTGPVGTGKGSDRLNARLQQKATQAAGAGATWIRADIRTGLWNLSQWAALPLLEKGETLARNVRQALSDITGVHGAVLSSGTATRFGEFADETVDLSRGGVAMRQALGAYRGREMIIIPLEPGHDDEVTTWRELYEKEPDWLDWALRQVGMSSAAAVFATI